MAFKLPGWSPFKKETNLPEEEQHRKTEETKELKNKNPGPKPNKTDYGNTTAYEEAYTQWRNHPGWKKIEEKDPKGVSQEQFRRAQLGI